MLSAFYHRGQQIYLAHDASLPQYGPGALHMNFHATRLACAKPDHQGEPP
jgi:hypothetical protein